MSIVVRITRFGLQGAGSVIILGSKRTSASLSTTRLPRGTFQWTPYSRSWKRRSMIISGGSKPVIGIHSWRFAVRITRRFHRSSSVQCRKRTSRRATSLSCGAPEPKLDDATYTCSKLIFLPVVEVPWTVSGPSEYPEPCQIPGQSAETLISQSSAPSPRDQRSTPAVAMSSRPAIQKVPRICSPCSRRACSFARNASWPPSPTRRSVTDRISETERGTSERRDALNRNRPLSKLMLPQASPHGRF